jgi:FtsP/CotA-like multicopper oxidase with cupredoxin domain
MKRPILAVRRRYALVAGVLLACAPADAPDGARELAPTLAIDLDPAPDRVRFVLVASLATTEYLPGKPAQVWAYRDAGDPDGVATVPGPLLRAPLGASVEIELRNELEVDTTIHWHGVRVPAMQDGTPTAQIPVAPGERFTYTFDAVDAGTFWYHPHVEGDVQIERGLYGAFVVDGPEVIDVAAERVLVLDDVKLEADGRLSEDTDALDLMLGRQGNVLLVDGQRRPSVAAQAGTRERWRFINAANGRYFSLQLSGASWRVIGSDGGLLPAPIATTTLLVAPGERYDVLVDLPVEAGTELVLETVYYDRGHDIPDPGPLALLDVVLAPGGVAPAPLPKAWGTVAALPVDASTPTRELVLSENDDDAEDPRFFIDGAAFPAGDPVMVDQGALEVWTLRNDAEMDHPFHIHGLFFQVLDDVGVPRTELGWKDTVNVPQKSSVRLAARFDNPGEWMMHCHILEHAERGMMGMLHVMP